MVERLVANEKVEGSTPFARSTYLDIYNFYVSLLILNAMKENNGPNVKELFNLAFQNQKKKILKRLLVNIKK